MRLRGGEKPLPDWLKDKNEHQAPNGLYLFSRCFPGLSNINHELEMDKKASCKKSLTSPLGAEGLLLF